MQAAAGLLQARLSSLDKGLQVRSSILAVGRDACWCILRALCQRVGVLAAVVVRDCRAGLSDLLKAEVLCLSSSSSSSSSRKGLPAKRSSAPRGCWGPATQA